MDDIELYRTIFGRTLSPPEHKSALSEGAFVFWPGVVQPDRSIRAQFGSERTLAATYAGSFSNPNALCSTRTASSMYFSSTTTEILISDVEIIWMLIPSSDNVRNI